MKKVIFLTLLIFNTIICTAFSSNDLVFKPAGGGKFIYCNNPEGITADDLADGENPIYLMNNENLTPDKYVLYLTHFNLVTDSIDENTRVPGRNIYLNAVFTAVEDSVIVLNRTAFEIPDNTLLYKDGKRVRDEGSFSSLNGCADLMNETICTIKTEKVYKPSIQDKRIINIKKGDKIHLGDYIENYTSVPYPKHVFMAADMEIASGIIDIDVFASYSRFLATEPQEGYYVYDKTQKGIADSLPRVETELEYTLDDTISDNTLLPVTVYNQYVPEGNTITEWVTNLNPLADMYTKRIVCESDLLPLSYRDPYKLSRYGENVPESERNDTYIFDPFHSDTSHFPGNDSGYTKENYIPNYPQSPDNDTISYSCNMGNYGVTTCYNLKVHNHSEKDRYFDYVATCTSDLIVKVTDKNKNLLSPVISKGQSETQTTDTLASVFLPAGETTEFTIEVTLPVQNFGGPKQSFKISDEKTEHILLPASSYPIPDREYVKPSESLIDYHDDTVARQFRYKLDNYNFVKTDYGYAAYYHVSAAKPFYYAAWWKICGHLYLTDDELHILKKYDLGSPPTDMSYSGGRLYVKTAKSGNFVIDSLSEPEKWEDGELPFESIRGNLVRMNGSKVQISFDHEKYFDVEFQSIQPDYPTKDGMYFKCRYDGNEYLSVDGIYWYEEPKLPFNDILPSGHRVMINNTLLGFDRNTLVLNDRILVPMRFIFEKFNLSVDWNQEKQTATAYNDDTAISFKVNSNRININGKEKEMDVECINKDGRVLIPIRALSEELGYNVDWIHDYSLAVISKS